MFSIHFQSVALKRNEMIIKTTDDHKIITYPFIQDPFYLLSHNETCKQKMLSKLGQPTLIHTEYSSVWRPARKKRVFARLGVFLNFAGPIFEFVYCMLASWKCDGLTVFLWHHLQSPEGSQGSLFTKFRDIIMGITHFSTLDPPTQMKPRSVLE